MFVSNGLITNHNIVSGCHWCISFSVPNDASDCPQCWLRGPALIFPYNAGRPMNYIGYAS